MTNAGWEQARQEFDRDGFTVMRNLLGDQGRQHGLDAIERYMHEIAPTLDPAAGPPFTGVRLNVTGAYKAKADIVFRSDDDNTTPGDIVSARILASINGVDQAPFTVQTGLMTASEDGELHYIRIPLECLALPTVVEVGTGTGYVLRAEVARTNDTVVVATSCTIHVERLTGS